MEYEMAELAPIVGRLAEKYTGFESSSITYEKAEQLMGAVLYCIREARGGQSVEWYAAEAQGGQSVERYAAEARGGQPVERYAAEARGGQSVERYAAEAQGGQPVGRHFVAAQGGMSARQAYEAGLLLVEEKVKAALGLFNELLPRFASYGNRCLQEVFTKELPEFFKWYDIRFNPQDTAAALDYPVLRDLSGYTGIDKVYEYIRCICLEQKFLAEFPESFVVDAMAERDDFYQDMVENLCEAVLEKVLGQVLAGTELAASEPQEDYRRVRKMLSGRSGEEVRRLLETAAEAFLEEHSGEDEELRAYLMGALEETAVRMKNF